MPPPVVPDESARLATLQALLSLDANEVPFYDAIAALAASICGTPIALISLLGGNPLPTQLTPAQRSAMAQLATVLLQLFGTRQEVHRAVTALRLLSHHDSLTGLVNRTRFAEVLNDAVARSRRHGTGCALLYLDIDHFKPINDAHGHSAGDTVLREFARRLHDCARETDTVARLGGDEFGILLEDLHDAEGAIMVAGKIREALRVPFEVTVASLDVSVSIGIAFASLGQSQLDSLLMHADRALQRVKAGGRGDFLLAENEDAAES